MSTQTITVPASSSSSTLFLPNLELSHSKHPQLEDGPAEPSPQELLDKTLYALEKAEIALIEWGTLLHNRMGVPTILKHHHFLVPDDDLPTASHIASEEGLPLSAPPQILVDTHGDFFAKGRLHRLTSSTSPALAQYLILLPFSFASYTPSELDPRPRLTSLASPLCKTVLVPQRPAVYASILRAMTAYPRWSPTRMTLESHLSELIGYNLYDLSDGYVDIDDEELCQSQEVDQRVADAVQVVKEWTCAGRWRQGEEWIGDALISVVSGTGELGYLPWAAPPVS